MTLGRDEFSWVNFYAARVELKLPDDLHSRTTRAAIANTVSRSVTCAGASAQPDPSTAAGTGARNRSGSDAAASARPDAANGAITRDRGTSSWANRNRSLALKIKVGLECCGADRLIPSNE